MKKILYISYLNEDLRPGYKLKIHGQAKSFSSIGLKSYLLIVKNECLGFYSFVDGEEILTEIPFNKKRRDVNKNLYDDFFLSRQFFKTVKRLASELQINYLYIRRIWPTPVGLLRLIKSLRSKGCYIMYEYPSYPWKEDVKLKYNKTAKDILFYANDVIMCEILDKLVHKIIYLGVYNGNNPKFYRICNAGDPDKFPLVQRNKEKDIVLIGVAHTRYIHGYDKVIKGLKTYYEKDSKIKVYFNIVGTLDKSLGLEEMVEKYSLNEYVHFYGMKVGKELDDIFDQSDIGVNVLRGNEIKGIKKGATTLKTIEYTLRGLPQIASQPLDLGDGTFETPQFFYLDRGVDECNIENIIQFYQNLNESHKDIRDYGIKHFTWDKIYKKLFEEIKNEDI